MRIATYNILHAMAVPHGQVDLDVVAETIVRLDCDAVAVQEVDRGQERTGGVDQVGWLADRLGWDGVFGPALIGDPRRSWRAAPADDPGGPAFGVGLLAQWPLSGVRRLPLPGGGDGRRRPRPAPGLAPWWPGWDREPRVALSADVTVGGLALRLVTVHLSYLPWRAVRQLRIAKNAAGRGRTVLLGDFNLPVFPARAALGRGWKAAVSGPTYPAWRPRIQADQIHVTAGLELTDVTAVPTGSSDHLPLVATVTG